MTTIRYVLANSATDPKWLYATYDAGTSQYYFKYHNGYSNLYPNVIGTNSANSAIFDAALIGSDKLSSIFSQWSSAINVDFSTSSGEKLVYIGAVQPTGSGYSPSATTLTAQGALNGENFAGQYAIIFNYGQSAINVKDLSLGTWGGWSAMHELGHVLGLSHSAEPAPRTSDFRFSIMDYPSTDAANKPLSTIKIPLTPGMTDIATLQANPAYGISHTTDGNDTYKFTDTSISFTASTGAANTGLNVTGTPSNYVMTLWDSVGTDTIDASSMNSSVYITLEAGKFSAIGSNIKDAPTSGLGGVEYNVGIAIGAAIENAKGGNKNDTLIGNQLNNTLDGGIGADTLKGGLGNDTYVVDSIGDIVTELAGEGTDWVQSKISVTLTDNVENLMLTGTAAINGTGNEQNNILMGNAANNRLEGKGGNDIYTVNSAGDVIVEQQGGGADTIYTTASITMAANVENLVVDLTATLTVTGNAPQWQLAA